MQEWAFPTNATEARERRGFSILIQTDRGAVGHIVAADALFFSNSIVTASGTATGTSTADSGFVASALQSGGAAGTSAASSLVVGVAAVVGSAAGTSLVSSTILGAALLTGSSAGTSAAVSTVQGIANQTASAAGTSNATGLFSARALLIGSAAGNASTTAAVLGLATLLGSAAGTSTAVSGFSGSVAIAGTAAGTSTSSSLFEGVVLLAGNAAGTSSATALLSSLANIFPDLIRGRSNAQAEIIVIYPAGYVAQSRATPNSTSTRGPLREFYLKYSPSGMTEGPYTYYEAEGKARTATRDAARTGVGDLQADLIQIVGTRQGDPTDLTTLRVVYSYLAGRKTSGGALALYNYRKRYP